MKNTTQAWGWLTAGVLALGLNGIYHDGGTQWAHRMFAEATYHVTAALAPVSGQVDEFLAKVQMASAGHATQSCRRSTGLAQIQAVAARAQSGMARAEALSAREQAQLARLEARRARIEAQAAPVQFADIAFDPAQFSPPRVHVTCPRVRVVIPDLPVKPISVHGETAGTGPI